MFCIFCIKTDIHMFLSDPDAPSRAEPSKREILHWLIVNIPGNDIKQGEVHLYISPTHLFIFNIFIAGFINIGTSSVYWFWCSKRNWYALPLPLE